MRTLKDMYLGSSIAISWAWGTSLILGMEITRTKGLETFLIWAIANTLTLTIFGLLFKKKILVSKVLDTKIVRIFTNLIQIFCLIIQLKILDESLQAFMTAPQAYMMTVLMSGGLVWWMYKKGLAASILSDLFQGIFTLLVLGSMVLYAYANFPSQETPHSSIEGITWGIWSAIILLSGIMTDLQHWQRAEVNKDGKAFEWASIFFGIYLLFVYILSKYNFNSLLDVLLLLAVIGVTTGLTHNKNKNLNSKSIETF